MTVTPPAEVPANAPVVRRAPRWMWVTLVVSVALNLLVLGMAAAAFLHFRKGPGGPASKMARFIETLPSERREKLQPVLDARRSRFQPLRREMRQARRRARDAFVAEPFDRNALVGAYADAAKARMALTKARQEWFENLALLMTAKERREYLETRHHRGRHKWRRH